MVYPLSSCFILPKAVKIHKDFSRYLSEQIKNKKRKADVYMYILIHFRMLFLFVLEVPVMRLLKGSAMELFFNLDWPT